jgi:membrane-bound metal-dependent hydrolase YbcI (DUF457 family)
MLLWFVGMAFVLVVQVFHDGAIDYRLVMLGAVLPDVIDGLFGGPRLAHTLLFAVAHLFLVMAFTQRRRKLRRRLLALPIGVFAHLLLDGVWTDKRLFWWPAFGTAVPDRALASFSRPLVVSVAMEFAGAAALLWGWRRFRLAEDDRRRAFFRTGRLGRDLLA